jgi:1,2-phenylacetyl-CoA epoxidase PaaB subunit
MWEQGAHSAPTLGGSHHARPVRAAVADGVFLQRPELTDLWDAKRRYIEEQRPRERATFVFRNTDLTEPELVTNRN